MRGRELARVHHSYEWVAYISQHGVWVSEGIEWIAIDLPKKGNMKGLNLKIFHILSSEGNED